MGRWQLGQWGRWEVLEEDVMVEEEEDDVVVVVVVVASSMPLRMLWMVVLKESSRTSLTYSYRSAFPIMDTVEWLTISFLDFGFCSGPCDSVGLEGFNGPAIEFSCSESDMSLSESSSFM